MSKPKTNKKTAVKTAPTTTAPVAPPEPSSSQPQLLQLWAQYGILRARKDAVEADMVQTLNLITQLQKQEG